MNNQPDNMRESLWRRKLSDAERAGLRAQPELELEARLTDALARISDAPVPSNFTARVLDAVELEEKQATRSHGWNWHFLLPRMAVAAAVLVFAGVSIQRYEANSHRAALVRNVVLLAASQPLPSVDALENLDAIQRMSQSAPADGDLLAALQ
jgi:negative regulator of sigma E activity